MRRRTEDAGSLDLLLDTVTNTFGGVFFVAVLVTMMLRVTSPVATTEGAKSKSQSEKYEQRKETKAAELRSLELALAQHQSTLDNLTTDGGKEEYEELARLRAEFDGLAKKRIDLQSRLNANEAALLRSRSTSGQIQSDIAKELQSNEELERLIDDEQVARTRTLALPTLRETDKFEFPIIVRYGRVYSAYVPDPVSMKRRNVEEFAVLGDENGVTRISPKPYKGVRLNQLPQCEEAVLKRLNGIDTSHTYIAIAVWEDSFVEFGHLRRILVDAGFEYRLLPIPAGQMVWEGGTGERFVQ